MGGSALRAMAFARPLIVQGEQGFWETLTPATAERFLWTGWYGAGDGREHGPARLEALLGGLLEDRGRRLSLGAYSRELVEERFSLQSAALRQLELYQRALETVPSDRRALLAPERRLGGQAGGVPVPEPPRPGARPLLRRRLQRQGGRRPARGVIVQRLAFLDRRILVIVLCTAVASVCAIWSVCTISLLPPSVSPRQMDIAAASARIAIDRPKPLIGDDGATEYDYETLQTRAVLIATLASTEPAVDYIARRAGVDPDDLVATSPVTSGVQTVFTEPDSERRAEQIASAAKPYRLEARAGQTLPIVDLYAQAPTVAEAQRLADAVVPAMREYLAESAREEGADPAKQEVLTQLGHARGAMVSSGTQMQIAFFTFLYAFAITLALTLIAIRLRMRGRQAPARRGARRRRSPATCSSTRGTGRARHGCCRG